MACLKKFKIQNSKFKIKVFYSLFFILYSLFYPFTSFANWSFDTTPPFLSSSLTPGSFTETTITSIVLTASDYGSGIFTFAVTPATGATLVTPNGCLCNPGTSVACVLNACPTNAYTSQVKRYNWSPTNAGGPDYSFTLTSTDNAGNIASTTLNFTIIPGISAWIKTTSGDVHSNTRISAPGGP